MTLNKVLITTFLLTLSLTSQAKGRSVKKRTSFKKSEIKKGNVSKKSKESYPSLSLSGSLSHFEGFKENIDPFSTFSLRAGLKFSKTTSLSVSQSITKNYYIDEIGGDELSLADTRIRMSNSLGKIPEIDVNTKISYGINLPTSEVSNTAERVMRFVGSASFTKSFLKKKLTLGLIPFGFYNWNQYQSSIDGKVYTQYAIGNKFLVSFAPIE